MDVTRNPGLVCTKGVRIRKISLDSGVTWGKLIFYNHRIVWLGKDH